MDLDTEGLLTIWLALQSSCRHHSLGDLRKQMTSVQKLGRHLPYLYHPQPLPAFSLLLSAILLQHLAGKLNSYVVFKKVPFGTCL